MSEKYFPGFTFSLPRQEEILFIPSETKQSSFLTPHSMVLIDFSKFDEENIEFDEVVESEVGWEFSSVISDFNLVLSSMSTSSNYHLTMENKSVQLVPPEDMLPKTERERSQLVQLYGTYILDGMAGSCRRNPDGSFDLKLGYAGLEEMSTKDDVLGVLAHEFGHTLGERLPDAIFEELKAYAFSIFFMRHYLQVDAIFDLSTLSPEKTHDIARHYLDVLLARNISEEAILAHLIDKDFGTHTPDTWSILNSTSRNVLISDEH